MFFIYLFYFILFHFIFLTAYDTYMYTYRNYTQMFKIAFALIEWMCRPSSRYGTFVLLILVLTTGMSKSIPPYYYYRSVTPIKSPSLAMHYAGVVLSSDECFPDLCFSKHLADANAGDGPGILLRWPR